MKSEFVLTHVEYAYNKAGYTVKVIQEGDVIEDYTAGNCRFDSQVYLSEHDPQALPLQTIGKYARQTANEMMHEFDADSVSENEDWLN